MITLPTNFEADIQGQNLNLYPVVIIDIDSTGTNPDLHLSTKEVKLGSRHFKPLLLNIPSVKESMDFENRNYRISSVNLKISNFEFEGERFSDYPNNLQGTMGEDFPGSLINVAVKIYWISQSFPSNHTIGFDNDGDAYALQVYKGFVRRYSHDEKTVTLFLEDSTQTDLHKDVPVARLGDGVTIPDKYRNKPIPMVYGYVDKSPCVIAEISSLGEELTSFDEINIYTDSDDTVALPENDPLYLYNDAYVNIRKTEVGSVFKDEDDEPLYGDGEQYSVLDNIITLLPSYEDSEGDSDDDVIPTNVIANNHIIGFEIVRPSVVKPLTGLKSKGIGDFSGYSGAYYSTIPETTAVYTEDEGLFRIYGTCFVEHSTTDWGGQSFADPEGNSDITWERIPGNLEAGIVGCVMTMPVLSSSSYSDHVARIGTAFKGSMYDKHNWRGTSGDFRIRLGGNKVGDYNFLKNYTNQQGGTEDEPRFFPLGGGSGEVPGPTFNNISTDWSNYQDEVLDVETVSELLFYVRWLPTEGNVYQKGICVCQLEVIDLYVEHYVLLDDILKYGYYATVNGRTDFAYTAGEEISG